jgi:hypothetical protein
VRLKGNAVAVKRASPVSVASLTGDRGFESISLHRRVHREPDFLELHIADSIKKRLAILFD